MEEENPHENDIGYFIKVLNDTLKKRADKDLRGDDMTLSQLRVLHFIYLQEGCQTTQKTIEDYLGVSHPTVNGLLKRLESKGRIVTEIAVNRRLTKIVRMSETGMRECKNAEEARMRHERLLSRNLTAEEKQTLLTLLQKVLRGLNEEIELE